MSNYIKDREKEHEHERAQDTEHVSAPVGNGEKLTIRWAAVRNLVGVIALASMLFTVISGYVGLKNTTESNATRIVKIEDKLDSHLRDVNIHTDKTSIKETKEDLLRRIDLMQRQVDNANDKLDRILSRGK